MSVKTVDEQDPQRLMAVLQFLTELGQAVASNTELQPILDWIVAKTTAMLEADEGSIKLLGPDADSPMAKTLVRKQSAGIASGSWPPAVAMSVMGYLLHRAEFVATPDLTQDERFPGLRNVETRVRAVLAVPLKVDNRITGVLAVTQASPGRAWTPGEIQLLSIVAGNSAGVIEQARLRAEAMEKQRLEEEAKRLDRELNVARDIQMNLVPSRPLQHGRWSIFGRVVPARQVGGDSFDYFAIEQNRLAFAIGDVSGKGVPASLMMSNVSASLRAFCASSRPIPEKIRNVNESVARSAAAGKFITLFYGELDPEGVLRYTNAGHNYPLLRRAEGAIEELKEGGMPLGLFEGADFIEGEVRMAPGDTLLLYSDGVSEANDIRGEEFGEDRLLGLWREHGSRTADESIAALLAEVEAFRGSAAQSDDITLVVLGSWAENAPPVA
jgi:phosphoserine phosphatase RsbU/P